jgi:FemAB-related protein (PEP-CTERM system-associated)
MEIEVQTLAENPAAWNEFVARSSSASFYHDFAWKGVIERTFGHKCHYLMAFERGDVVRGILPLVEMKSLAFGHFLVSLPFLNYGGVLAENGAVANALCRAAADLARRKGGRHIELRQAGPVEIPWACRQHKVALVVGLPANPDHYWAGLSSRLRGKIRKAQRAGAKLSVAGPEGLSQFYSVFARNMRDLGTPVYPRRFFDDVLRSFPGSSRLFLVKLDGQSVAGALAVNKGRELELPWICSNYDHSRNYVNELLYWSVLEWASAQGFKTADLGRSTIGTGPYKFKKQWNPGERPLHWYYWTAGGAGIPELSPENPKYALAIRCWQKLPLSIANSLGPWIVRNIP